jgi:hypothetical protein
MTPGSTRPQTEMSKRIYPRGKGSRCVGLTTLLPAYADCHEITELQSPGAVRAFQACDGIALVYILLIK